MSMFALKIEHVSVIPRKSEFSENCLSPRPQPNIEKNVILIQMFLFLNSDALHFDALNENISASSGTLSR